MCPATKVLPSQATPKTHTHATIPLLKTDEVSGILLASTLQKITISVAMVSIALIMAASRGTMTFAIKTGSPPILEIAVA